MKFKSKTVVITGAGSGIGRACALEFAKEGVTVVVADLDIGASGKNTATGGGNPTNKIITKNALILSDFTPCLNGYWGDS
jgi:NAD(P)-dependent dehydrogenase (short-subunit alcohol dehydrogenase family)